MHPTFGLDIGGANLKAAHTNGVARTVAFPLWKHPDRLSDELARLGATMPPYARLAVTMTGELCDCFASKSEGVRAILRGVGALSVNIPIRVWCTHDRFLACAEAMDRPHSVAAANWLALAHYVARRYRDEAVLLIDTGSTTTDIVYLHQGIPEPRGRTDRERLATGELVYTGVRRTPICAVLGMEVAAEFFATMLDAYIYLGLLPEIPADRATADGRSADRAGAHARLARMRCADAEDFSATAVRDLAERAVQTQWQAVGSAIDRILQNRQAVHRIVVSGSGEVLGRNVCARHALLARIPVTSLAETLGAELSEAACAYAVAMLAANEEGP